jgi:hypothetical protein
LTCDIAEFWVYENRLSIAWLERPLISLAGIESKTVLRVWGVRQLI